MMPRPQEKTYLCQCTYRGCINYTDPDTGQHGVPLTLRLFKLHEKSQMHADKRGLLTLAQQSDLEKRATSVNAQVLDNLEESMASALQALSLENRTSEKSGEDGRTRQYRVDMVKAKIRQLSKVEDDIDRLQTELDAIGSPGTSAVSDDVIYRSLERCEQFAAHGVEMARELRLSNRGTCSADPSVSELRKDCQRKLSSFRNNASAVYSAWDDVLKRREEQIKEDTEQGIGLFDSSEYFRPILQGVPAVVQLVIFMVVVCNLIFSFPRRGSWWIFSMTEHILQTTLQLTLGIVGEQMLNSLKRIFGEIMNRFPKDVRTARDQFRLEANATVYAVCTSCHETHKSVLAAGVPAFPERCNGKRHGKRCREILVRPKMKENTEIFVPIKAYVSFEFKDWLAGILSRNNYEKMMDEAWQGMAPSPDGIVKDVFQGTVIQEFKGPDRVTHFSQAGGQGAGHYLFSLGCDFFNPFRNLAGGKKVSVGVIALVCLNLPIHIRYQPENIFLAGIIPGPHEPSLDAINPYLRPIVDTFLELWTGVRFSKTFLHELGRVIFCAIIAVICDLPAARKVGGFASFKHEYYCTVCWCNRTLTPYNNFNYSSWRRRYNEECRGFAEAYASAPSSGDADKIFDRSGLRSSELLRLPYYDPTKHLVIDPMHNLFLGLIKEHFQNILGYSPKSKTTSKTGVPAFRLEIEIIEDNRNTLPDDKVRRQGVKKLLDLLAQPLNFNRTETTAVDSAVTNLSQLKIPVDSFLFVARGLGCSVPNEEQTTARPTKKELARLLMNWRLSQAEPVPSSTSGKHGCIFTAAEMEAIWHDIRQVVKPSWTTSVPPTVSTTGPKLKSDQWRTFGSLYLPITLIRLWSDCSDDAIGKERRSLLEMTMHLLSAIKVASSRETSVDHAEKYLAYMLKYRESLKAVFPTYECHANHHVAMHLGELLIRYGPMHGWWTFPFERMIGTLQRIPTNYKTGEYEETIGRSWYRSSNLRALFSRTTCPQPIESCKKLFMTLIKPDQRNSLAADSGMLDVVMGSSDSDAIPRHIDELTDTPKSQKLPEEIVGALSQYHSLSSISEAKSVDRIALPDGTYITTHAVHEGNSCVLFKGSDLPYRIEKIIMFPETSTEEKYSNTWLVVRWHRIFRGEDPYKQYPHLKAKLWNIELEATLGVIAASQVDAHYAKCAIPWRGQQALVIVSLSHTNPQ